MSTIHKGEWSRPEGPDNEKHDEEEEDDNEKHDDEEEDADLDIDGSDSVDFGVLIFFHCLQTKSTHLLVPSV